MSNIIEIIKYRKGKISSRKHDGRVWIPDRELEQTAFAVGAEYTVKIQEDKHEIQCEIKPGGERKVARRKVTEEKIAPVIDIKNLRVKHTLDDCDYITIAIYKNRIVVRGHKHTANTKVEEYQQDRNPLKLTSFTFFGDDAPAREAGFDSKGFLLTEDAEGVTYSVPLGEFEASILPGSHVWFVNLSGERNANMLSTMHLLRLYNQVATDRRPYVIAIDTTDPQELAPVEVFLQSDGYHVTMLERGKIFSVLEGQCIPKPEIAEDLYRTVYRFLTDGLQKIEKRIPMTVVSLYSGCISDLAFKEMGFKILKAYDLNKELANEIGLDNFSDPEGSYRLNIGDEFTPADISKLMPNEIPKADIVVSSPTCHGVSIENQRTRFIDNPKNIHMWITLNTIKQMEPLYFMIEQVSGILKIGEGIFLRDLHQELGTHYHIDYAVIDAAECGTAQHRERAIFIGSRVGEIKIPIIKAGKYKTVREALEGITDELPNQQDITTSGPEVIERMKHIPPGGNHKDIPPELRPGKMGKSTHSCMYRRLDPDKPAYTLVNFRKTLLIHPYENRIISVREAARLTDLPDLYEFVGKLSERQQQISNSIPLRLVRKVAGIIRNHYQENLFNTPLCAKPQLIGASLQEFFNAPFEKDGQLALFREIA